MPEIPVISGKEAIKVLENLGFKIVRKEAVMWFYGRKIKVVLFQYIKNLPQVLCEVQLNKLALLL